MAESFGFNQALRDASSGFIFSHLVLDHWDIVSGDPFNSESMGGKLVEEIRLRKGLKPGIPALQNFIDQE